MESPISLRAELSAWRLPRATSHTSGAVSHHSGSHSHFSPPASRLRRNHVGFTSYAVYAYRGSAGLVLVSESIFSSAVTDGPRKMKNNICNDDRPPRRNGSRMRLYQLRAPRRSYQTIRGDNFSLPMVISGRNAMVVCYSAYVGAVFLPLSPPVSLKSSNSSVRCASFDRFNEQTSVKKKNKCVLFFSFVATMLIRQERRPVIFNLTDED